MDRKSILRQFGFFKGISDKSLSMLSEICLEKTVEKKQILFTEGESGHALFFCTTGRIQLHKTTPDGKQVVIRVIPPGEIFGEVVLFEANQYPVTATALTKSRVFLMPKHQFHCLLEREDFRNDFIRMLMNKQRYLAEQIKYLTTYDVEDRLFLFLRENFGKETMIQPSMSKKDIASAIGTTPETLSRILLRLKKDELLVWEDKRIRIHPDVWERGERNE